jgi:hypothetical protein
VVVVQSQKTFQRKSLFEQKVTVDNVGPVSIELYCTAQAKSRAVWQAKSRLCGKRKPSERQTKSHLCGKI